MNMHDLAAWAGQRRPQLRLSLRIIIASLATFAIGHLLGLVQTYWAVLTAVIVSQASVGGSLKATTDRFIGSLGGAAWGVAVSLSLPHATIWGLALTLTAALAPLAVLTALNPAYRMAPVTAIILLLTPTSQTAGPVVAAFQRMLEIGLGSVVALAVALLVLPERAHGVLSRAAAQALDLMADLTAALARGLAEPRDAAAADALHGAIRKAITAAEAAALEAVRERRINLAGLADPEPLCRTLRRLHNDLAMVGRASPEPLAGPVRDALAGPAMGAAEAIAARLREVGQAIAAGKAGPSAEALDQALATYGAAVAALRRGGLTRELPVDAVGRIFSLTFTLEQLQLNLRDLADRAAEIAGA
jgi:uncharacterized membrane protein YccC